MSENNGGNLSLVEWDGYRYIPYIDNAGHKGILLLGVSHRAYDNNSMVFMHLLKTYRAGTLQQLSKYSIPQIQIK